MLVQRKFYDFLTKIISDVISFSILIFFFAIILITLWFFYEWDVMKNFMRNLFSVTYINFATLDGSLFFNVVIKT